MTSQQPAQFENYPLEPDPGAPVLLDAPVQGANLAFAPPPGKSTAPGAVSRRIVIATAIGICVAGVVLAVLDDDSGGDVEVVGETAEVGDHSASVADNWTVMSSEEGELVLGNGSNRLYAWADSLPVGSLAVDALEPMVKRTVPDIAGLKTSVGAAVDASSADVQRASLAGAGTLGQRSAQLIANIWITADGQYLFTIRILTDKVNSDAAYGAQQMLDDLSEDFS